MALTAMHITRDPTGAIDIGLTDTGATIEKVPSVCRYLQSVLSIVHSKNEIVSQASPSHGPEGFSTTLMHPSFLSRKVL
jgi:hypothetical protein